MELQLRFQLHQRRLGQRQELPAKYGLLVRRLFRKHRNYVWTQSEVNRNFFDNRFYVSVGYDFTWKDYEQKDRRTGAIQSENTYHRNKAWAWLSYRVNDDTNLNFGAEAERVKTHTENYKDKSMVYTFSGMLYHRWNKNIWTRFNYWCDTSYHQIEQVTEYGYFTDSLTMTRGNPALHIQVYHSGQLWMDFFNIFNIRTGFNYSSTSFSNIIGSEEGTLPSGNEGAYVVYKPENTLYKEFWMATYFLKKIKDFKLRGVWHIISEKRNSRNTRTRTEVPQGILPRVIIMRSIL